MLFRHTTSCQDEAMNLAPFNHSPLAVFDEGVLSSGAALYAELAVNRLRARPAHEPPPVGSEDDARITAP
jgi:hypothetical protein